jgi:hypothetical protein
MVQRFKDDDEGYLRWIEGNQGGYVVNMDEPPSVPQYPMLHSATHKLLSTPKRTNYTTGKYFKVCSTDLEALEKWSQRRYGKSLTRCAQCM